jgi:ketosteroid isomerase-like protein
LRRGQAAGIHDLPYCITHELSRYSADTLPTCSKAFGMERTKYFLVGFLVLARGTLDPAVLGEQTSANAKTASVEGALSAFLTVFDNLDWQAFRTCFSATATIFHPAAPNIKLIDSPDQFDKAWLGVFERIKKSVGRASPPYMNLNPVDLCIEKLSEDVALVTFHLTDNGTVNRRTIAFKRQPDGWKIVLIHASNIAAP